MKIVRAKTQAAVIPTASMADIAFLLIIFFMVTTVYDVDRTNVALPTSSTRVENEKGAAIVVLHEDKNDQIIYKFSDGEKTSYIVPGPQEIFLEATRITAVDSTKQFILKADTQVRYELVDELLDNLRRAGASQLLLLTMASVDDSEGPS